MNREAVQSADLARAKAHENAITFDKIKLDNAIEAGDYGDIVKYTDDIVEHYKAMQNEVHLQAEYYRSIGYAETSDEITKLKSLWWDYYEEIKNVSADAWQQVVDPAQYTESRLQNGCPQTERKPAPRRRREICGTATSTLGQPAPGISAHANQ